MVSNSIESPKDQTVEAKASGNGDLQSDLEETRRALASLEASLSETYKTAGRLEESVARLKQLVILQEARIKQSELRKKE